MCLLAPSMFGLAWVCAPAIAEYLGIASGTTLIRLSVLNLSAMAFYYAYDSIFNGRRMFAAQGVLTLAADIAQRTGRRTSLSRWQCFARLRCKRSAAAQMTI
jgi:hypothetical protein